MAITIMDRRLEHLRPHAHRIADMLGLDDLNIIIRADTENFVREGIPHIIHIAPAESLAAGLCLVDVLAHEMRHVQQFYQRRIATLAADQDTHWLWWDGQLMECTHEDDRNAPWEQDAMQFEHTYGALVAREAG